MSVLSSLRTTILSQEPRRQVCGFPAAASDTPHRAGFTAGIAYGLWGLAPRDVERLTLITRELTEHAAARTLSERLLVVADYTVEDRSADVATVSVIALGVPGWESLDLDELHHVRPGDLTGAADHAMGPALFVRVEAMRP
ncbi:hypothetical protein [Streptomyces sp. NPDC055607]